MPTHRIKVDLDVDGDVNLPDSKKLQLGDGQDLQIYHDGSNSFIVDYGTGDMLNYYSNDWKVIKLGSGEVSIWAQTDAGVKLFYDNSLKLETVSAGVEITGELQADTLDIDGNADILGDLGVEGAIYQQNTYGTAGKGVFAPMVQGGMYAISSSTITGRLRIKVPAYKSSQMQTFYIDVYEYDTDRSATYRVSGYNYSDTNATWYNTSVVALFDSDNRDLTVRFGADTSASAQYVAIGETDSTWSYPQVVIRDYASGYNASVSEATGAFTIEFVTTDGATYNVSHDNNQPMANWSKIESIPSNVTNALPTTGGTMSGAIAMGNQNITGAGTITGTTLTGTSLDINGNADISGNLTGVDTLTATTFSGDLNGTINSSTTATTQSASNNSTKVATTAYVDAQVATLVDSAPGALNTLNELAAAINDDASFSTTVTNSIAAKLPLAGGTMSGAIAMGNNNISGVGNLFVNAGALSITGDGSNAVTLTESGGGDFTIDAPDDIRLDAGGGDIVLKDDGTEYGRLSNSGADFVIKNITNDKNVVFQASTGGSTTTFFFLDGDQNNTNFQKDLMLTDNKKALFGGSGDLQIYHDSNHSYIDEAGTGDLYIRSADNMYFQTYGSGKKWITLTEDAGVDLFHNDSLKLATKSDGVDITGELQCDTLDVDGNADISGNLTMSGNGNVVMGTGQLKFADGGDIYLGDSNDLKLYHDGSNSYIEESGTGNLKIRTSALNVMNAANSENMISATENGAVTLYYDNASKLTTASGGINVTGTITSTGQITGTELEGTSLDINGNADISGNLTGLDNVTSTNFIIGGHTINDVDQAGEFVDADDHLMSSAAIQDKILGYGYSTTTGTITGTGAANRIAYFANSSMIQSNAGFTFDGTDFTAPGAITGASLDINGNGDISGDLTGIDTITANVLSVQSGITHDGDINNKIVFTTDVQTFSCDGNESLIIRGNAVEDEPLFEINGAGAGNQLNIGLLLKGVTDGNPIKMKMQAPNNSSSVTGAGILSYEPDADTFNIGQSTTHNSMAISINNSDQATFTNAATLSGGFVLDGNTITGVDNASEFTDDDNHIMTSTAIKNKIADNDNSFMLVSTTTTQTGTKTFSGVIDITNTTDSSNATGDTGALRCEGGGSIAKKLYVGSTITGSADVIAFSDKKLKENIETLDGKKVLDMRGVSFTRKDTGAESSGVIAQEIQKVAPELVHDTEGTLGVAYGNLVGYLIEAIKDQQKQIDELKTMINGSSR